MSISYYINVADVGGSSPEKNFENWLKIDGLTLDALTRLSGYGDGGSVTASRVELEPLTIDFEDDTALAAFVQAGLSGERLDPINIVAVQPTVDGSIKQTFEIRLDQVFVENVTDTTGAGFSVDLVPGTIGIAAEPVIDEGGAKSTDFGWNLAEYKAVDFDAIATPPAPTAVPAVPDPGTMTYYIAFDGIDGEVTTSGFEGWSLLKSVKFDVSNVLAVGAETGGKPSAGPIALEWKVGSILPELMQKLSTGQIAKGVEIKGVYSGSGDGDSFTAYELSLDQVLVTRVDAAQGDYAKVELDWERMSLETFGAKNEGLVEPVGPLVSFDKVKFEIPGGDVYDATPSLANGRSVEGTDTFFYLSEIAGDGLADSFEGWLKVGKVEMPTELSVLGGTGSTYLNFDPITLTFDTDTGLTDFLRFQATGKALAGGTLADAVVLSGTPSKTVSTIDLKALAIASVEDIADAGFKVELDYAEVEWTNNRFTSGKIEEVKSFGFSLETREETSVDSFLGKEHTARASVDAEGVRYYLQLPGMPGSDALPGLGLTGLTRLDGLKIPDILTSRGDLSLSFDMDAALPLLYGTMMTGKQVPYAEIIGVSSDGTLSYSYKMTDVLVTSIQTGGSGQAIGTDTVDLKWKSIGIQTTATDPATSKVESSSFGWDWTTRELVDYASIEGSDDGDWATVPTPTDYFIKFDGVDGEPAGDSRHDKWIEVLSMSQSLDRPVSTIGGGGTTASRVSHDGLTITTASDAGLTAMMKALATGEIINSLVIEGGEFSPDAEMKVLEQLKFGKLQVVEVEDHADGGYTVTLDPQLMGGKIFPTAADKAQPLEFGYDFAIQSTIDYSKLSDATIDTIKYAVPATATTSGYIKFDGVDGESTAHGYEGWFNVLDHKLLVAARQSFDKLGAAPLFDGLELVLDSKLFDAVALASLTKGSQIGDVEMHLVGPTQDGSDFLMMDVDLGKAQVEYLKIPDIDGESIVGLKFQTIEIETFGLDAAGYSGRAGFFGWDIMSNTDILPPTVHVPVSDGDPTPNRIDENVAEGTAVGITATSEAGATYTLFNDYGGRFKIDPTSGVIVTSGVINREWLGPSVALRVGATYSDGETAVASFALAIDDVNEFDVTVPRDIDRTADRVVENAALGTRVGLQAFSFDNDATDNGVTYALAQNPGNLFAIDPYSGVVTVAGAIDYETTGDLLKIAIIAKSTDGSSATQSFSIAVEDVPGIKIGGTPGTDWLKGTEESDVFFAGDGRDWVYALAGHDSVNAGGGNDVVYAGDGNDSVNGGWGADFAGLGEGDDLYTDVRQMKFGDDTVFGGAGNDTISTGGGNDRVSGDGNDDLLITGDGNDWASGGYGADLLRMQDGNDTADGGGGRDRLEMGAGNDLAIGGRGSDLAYLGDGDDTWRDDRDPWGDDRSFGGAGRDWLELGGGNDTATGGTGADTFVLLSTWSGKDEITDFTPGEDRLLIDPEILNGAKLTPEWWTSLYDASSPYLAVTVAEGQTLVFSNLKAGTDIFDDIALL